MVTNAAVLGRTAGHGARKAVMNAGTMGIVVLSRCGTCGKRRMLRSVGKAQVALLWLVEKARTILSKKGGIGVAFL